MEHPPTNRPLAGVVLAAGAGRRLSPLTTKLPKPLCPVGGRPLVDHALDRIRPHVEAVAVNLHHHAARLDEALPPEVFRSREPEPLGTAGALGRLRTWTGGRDVLLTNADAWFAPGLDLGPFVASWDRRRTRLLCVETGAPADFATLRYCGVALLPAAEVARLPATPSGLYEVSWAEAERRGDLDLVVHDGPVVDCGTPADYLRANLAASGGRSVTMGARLGAGSVVRRSVVWAGSEVAPGEVLVDAIRAWGLTVLVR